MWYQYVFSALISLAVALSVLGFYVKVVQPRQAQKRKDEMAELEEREHKLFRIYQSLEYMMDSFEEYIVDTKEELMRQKDEVARDMAAMLGDIEAVVGRGEERMGEMLLSARETASEIKTAVEQKQAVDENQLSFGGALELTVGKNARAQRGAQVAQLMREGYPAERIAQELSMQIGEVMLIMGIEKAKKK